MSRLVFAAVADDDTGASDLAGMLAEQGLRTLLVIDLPAPEQFLEWSGGYDSVVMAEGTRNLSPREAEERTRRAIRLLKGRDPRVFQIKYCSTFDSTPEGNIGPSIDAAMDELNEAFTIAVPALPVNGRTTYKGYHFAGGQLLSDSPMCHHPLTPMTNPNLVDLLGRQTKRRVGLAPYDEVETGAGRLKQCFRRLRAEGVEVAVVDCLNDEHLRTICRAASELRLLTGSSAFGTGMPDIFRERGWLSARAETFDFIEAEAGEHGCLLVAGSCSVATRGQNEWLASRGVPIYRLDARELLDGHFGGASGAGEVRGRLAAGAHCLLTTSGPPEEVRRVQEWGAGRGLSVPELGQKIAYALADFVSEVLQGGPAGGLVVAGGETSGAVCRRLELGALRVGRNIAPGVPLCFSLGKFRMPVVLKSGNFGGTDFYGRALDAIARPAQYVV
ncbi:MAG TPA: 3-oxo-tetronate kinase [Pyrinomonadaceae bacterium]|nr:3-oxo-tetronate kinase [Pyrinomonadaceae bacterium]